MNSQSIVVTNCIGVAMLIVLLISSHLVRQRRELSDKIFSLMIIVTASACIFEMLTFICDGKDFTGVRFINIVGSSWLFIANALISVLWCMYVDLRLDRSVRHIRTYYPKIAIPAFIAIIAVIANIWGEFIFRLDENNVYHREPVSYLYYISALGYFIFSVIKRNRYYKNYGRTKFLPVWIFLVPVFLGAVAQFFFYGVSLVWCSVALGLVGMHMSLQNELSYIDPLTKLYNRNYLHLILSDIRRRKIPTGGIMIDIDFFKSINDLYGHAVGDEALVEAAGIIKKNSAEKTTAIRYAGDEFIILMRTSDESEIADIIADLRQAVESFNEQGVKKYTLSFSFGHSMFVSEGSIDHFLKEMDKRMYEEKKIKHCRSTVLTQKK